MKGVLVIGGGIAGIQASLDLAESGIKTYLVERSPSIGGRMARLDKTFPTNDCSMCILSPKMVDSARHPNIELLTYSEVIHISGKAGNFRVKILKHPRYIDVDKCTGCGSCAEACLLKQKIPNEFDFGLAKRGAIYVMFPQAVPLKYVIDPEKCIFLKKGRCGKSPSCKEACMAGAINFDQKPEEIELEVGSIILAPGYEVFDPSIKQEYGYGVYQNVIAAHEFERILSASGPFGGEILRPSDGKTPGKIAFIQCVGSRDEKSNPYCSAVCCMYAVKEAIIAKEHSPKLDITIFYMDLRAFGKEFDYYYMRARDEYGINFRRCRVASIEEKEDGSLCVRYVKNGEPAQEEFDLVVLSVGIVPPEMKELSRKAGIKLDKYGFCSTSLFSPLETSVPGIYVGGVFSSPKDIPDSVAQASGASMKASLLAETFEVAEELLPERDVRWEPPRIGVFVCHCGFNIAGVVDVEEVERYAGTLPKVVIAERSIYTCSQDSVEKIKKRIEEHRLNRVVVAACSPRTHEPLFRNALREAGINPYLFEMANIRDQCSWVHSDEPAQATEKSKDLVRMAVAKARLLQPLRRIPFPVTKKALVIGGGLSGMTAALLLGEKYETFLVEKENQLGGNLRRIHHLLEEDPRKRLEEIVERVMKNGRIHVYTNGKIKSISGYVGNFSTVVESNGKEEEIRHGVVIVAVGAKEYKPREYLYGEDERIITQLELEEVIRKITPKNVVMIQCVGSRNDERPYCSRVCCFHAVKNALLLKERNPATNIYILYRDIRTYGRREEYYREASEKGIIFLRYDEENPPEVKKEDGKIHVRISDPLLEREILLEPDLVVLSSAIVPGEDFPFLAQLLKVPLSRDGFFLEAHMKLRPVDFSADGIFLCGLAHSPKFIDECISQASAAAARACGVLSKEEIEAEGIVSFVNEEACAGCGICESTCPYGAIEIYEKVLSAPEIDARVDLKVRKAKVNEAICKGCGACTAACPSGAIQQHGFTDEQMLSVLSAV